VASPDQISSSDRALASALSIWAGADATALLRHFGPERARAVAATLADAADLDSLRRAHAAQLGPDPGRVHPTWFVRALQEESPAVRLAVIRATAEPLRSILLRGLSVDPADLEPDLEADPDARQVALTLWTERLVGDLPLLADDPPAIAALTRLSPVGLYRLLRTCGVAKSALLDTTIAGPGFPDDPRLLRIVANDREAAGAFGRHALAGLGLMTLARLLADAEPYRLRWALQHLPYPIAKRIRVYAAQPLAAVKSVRAWESSILEAASSRLRSDGRPSLEPDGMDRP
jgi:hypothetical protein